jgi:hypothetical protein
MQEKKCSLKSSLKKIVVFSKEKSPSIPKKKMKEKPARKLFIKKAVRVVAPIAKVHQIAKKKNLYISLSLSLPFLFF